MMKPVCIPYNNSPISNPRYELDPFMTIVTNTQILHNVQGNHTRQAHEPESNCQFLTVYELSRVLLPELRLTPQAPTVLHVPDLSYTLVQNLQIPINLFRKRVKPIPNKKCMDRVLYLDPTTAWLLLHAFVSHEPSRSITIVPFACDRVHVGHEHVSSRVLGLQFQETLSGKLPDFSVLALKRVLQTIASGGQNSHECYVVRIYSHPLHVFEELYGSHAMPVLRVTRDHSIPRDFVFPRILEENLAGPTKAPAFRVQSDQDVADFSLGIVCGRTNCRTVGEHIGLLSSPNHLSENLQSIFTVSTLPKSRYEPIPRNIVFRINSLKCRVGLPRAAAPSI
ncbi:beta-fructofuranosidase, partial [Striga asiatica]